MFTGPHVRRKHSAHSNTVFDGNKYHLSSVIQTSQRWFCLSELVFGGSKALWFECILSLMGQGRGQRSPADQERQHWEYNGYHWKIQSICWSTFHSILLLKDIYINRVSKCIEQNLFCRVRNLHKSQWKLHFQQQNDSKWAESPTRGIIEEWMVH